jgi:hypothetical protein
MCVCCGAGPRGATPDTATDRIHPPLGDVRLELVPVERPVVTAPQRDAEQFTFPGREPRAPEVDAQPAAEADASLEVRVRLPLPAEGRNDVEDVGR